MSRRAPLRGLVAIVLMTGRSGVAMAQQPDVHACVVASDEGQRLRDAFSFRAALEQLGKCSADACPGPIRTACAQWHADLLKRIPTIVPAAQDAQGRDLVQVRVFADAQPIAERLDGTSVPLDPGPHVLRFVMQGDPPVEQQIVVREGEKDRIVAVVIPPPPTSAAPASALPGGPAPTRSRAAIPALAWVLGGASVLALGGFAYLGITGENERSSLQGSCAGSQTCDPAAVDSARTKLAVADAMLGVSVVSLAIATFLVLTRPDLDSTGAIAVARPNGGVPPWLQ